MPTLYKRTFNLKDSLSDTEVLDDWRFMEEVLPAGPASPLDTIGEGLFWCRSAEGRHYHIVGHGRCQHL